MARAAPADGVVDVSTGMSTLLELHGSSGVRVDGGRHAWLAEQGSATAPNTCRWGSATAGCGCPHSMAGRPK